MSMSNLSSSLIVPKNNSKEDSLKEEKPVADQMTMKSQSSKD